MRIANLKGDDHKTKGRMGNNLTLELLKWKDICGVITTLTGFSNLLVYYEED